MPSDTQAPFPLSPSSERRSAYRRQQDRRLRARERELEAVRHICQALFQYTDVDELIEHALRTALELVNAETGSVLLADRESKQLVFRHSIGEKPVARGTGIPWHHGLAGSVFKSGEPEVVANAKEDGRHCPSIDSATGYQTQDMIVLPLKQWEGEAIGVIEVMNKREGQLNRDDLSILSIISALTATVIEHARLQEDVKLAEVARVLGDISHDVKNLLMPITCGAGVLKSEIDDLVVEVAKTNAGKAQESQALCDDVISMVSDGAQRINDRVKEIADCVKGLSTPPQFTSCRIADVVVNVLKILRMIAEEKKVRLLSDDLDQLPIIQADERRLYNAFYNLVNNAIPEVPAGGMVTVRGHVDGTTGDVIVSVADTGRGMPPEVRDSLFTSRIFSRKAGGTGLGMKIIKDVVDAHKGRITVESKEGVGTTFYLRLPLDPSAAHTSTD